MVSAQGRDRIVDQFILAFTLPGVEVRSELRDVICSDFEFDGTRAGIIDQTIHTTLLPNLFRRAGLAESGRFTPGGATSQGAVTPHPFANYMTPTNSDNNIARSGFSFDSPSVPFSRSASFSAGGWNSRPRTPSFAHPESTRMSESPSRSRTDEPASMAPVDMDILPTSAGRDLSTPGPMRAPGAIGPTGPRWTAEGLGRSTVWTILLQLLSPMRALQSILTVELRVFVRVRSSGALTYRAAWSSTRPVTSCATRTHGACASCSRAFSPSCLSVRRASGTAYSRQSLTLIDSLQASSHPGSFV